MAMNVLTQNFNSGLTIKDTGTILIPGEKDTAFFSPVPYMFKLTFIMKGCQQYRLFGDLASKTNFSSRTVELGYNDIGLCDTSSLASYILQFQLIPPC